MQEKITWVDVSKEKPDSCRNVLVYWVPGIVLVGFFSDREDAFILPNGFRADLVTYWAESPKGPQE